MSGSWVAARLGIDPVRLDVMRRGGELLAVRPAGAYEWSYPAWQFGPDGKPLPQVTRVLEAARERGIAPDRVTELLDRRAGVVGGRVRQHRLRDALLAGDVDHVLAEIRRSA